MGSMDKAMQKGARLMIVAAEEDKERRLSSKKKQLMSDSIKMLDRERKKHSKYSSKNSSKNTIVVNNAKKLNLEQEFIVEERQYRSNEGEFKRAGLINHRSNNTPDRQNYLSNNIIQLKSPPQRFNEPLEQTAKMANHK